jgi:hypothetical protein
VRSLAVATNGKTFVSGSTDGTALIWDLAQVRPPAQSPKELSAEELDLLWQDMASDDAAKSYVAWRRLAGAPQQTVPFLRSHLEAVKEPANARHITQLIDDLDSQQFAVREKAAAELDKLGEQVEPALRKALAGKPTLETSTRLQQLLSKLDRNVRSLRAVELLEHLATPEARQLLQQWARGLPEARLTREAKDSLER